MINLLYSVYLDDQYRIRLPRELCRQMGLEPGRELSLPSSSKGVFLSNPNPYCAICGTRQGLRPFGRRFLCTACIRWIQETSLKGKNAPSSQKG